MRQTKRRYRYRPKTREDFQHFLSRVRKHLPALYAFVAREVDYLENLGELKGVDLSIEDIVDETFLRAMDRWQRRPPREEAEENWLKRLALQVIRELLPPKPEAEAASIEEPAEEVPELAPEEDIDTQIYEFYQPDEELRLEDLIPDPTAYTPEQLVEAEEFETWLYSMLRRVPRRDREIFIFHRIEGRDPRDVARMEGMRLEEVLERSERVRKKLLQWIEEYDPELAAQAKKGLLAETPERKFAKRGVPAGYEERLTGRLEREWERGRAEQAQEETNS
ncbi:MAG: sigma-70 family RNA polymerase sigma factor [Calditrichaeota bacterium]|nr:sigma-70 family RNA polymerase sigma factor [Calditrichota bacterium]